MKPKKFEKKLALNKKTVVNLNSGELNHVKGGCATEVQSCPQPNNTSMIMVCETCNQETCICKTIATCPGQNSCGILTCALKPDPYL